jgi:hypothetical protein
MQSTIQTSLKLLHQLHKPKKHPQLLLTILKNALEKITTVSKGQKRKAEDQNISSAVSNNPPFTLELSQKELATFESFLPATASKKRLTNSAQARILWEDKPAIKYWYRGEAVLSDSALPKISPKASIYVLFDLLYLNLPKPALDIIQNNQALIKELNLDSNRYYLMQLLKKTASIDQDLCLHLVNICTDISILIDFKSFLSQSEPDKEFKQLIANIEKRILSLKTHSQPLVMEDISPQTYFFISNNNNKPDNISNKELSHNTEPFLDLTSIQL